VRPVESWVARSAAMGLALLVAACSDVAGPKTPGLHPGLAADWVVASPADAGMDGAGLEAATDSLVLIPEFRSLLVARHARLVWEHYQPGVGAATLFDVRSVTKSIVATLTGIALHEGVLPGVGVSIAPFLVPAYTLDSEDSAVTVENLLTMTSGYQWNESNGPDYGLWFAAPDHVQYLLDRPHAYAPGTTFTYNSAGAHTLGVVLQRASGTELWRYAAGHLMVPLGVKNMDYQVLDRGTDNGGAGFALTGRDLLKFGQLMLQEGWSGNVSVVPASWVLDATRPHFDWRVDYGAEHAISYGYLWWTADAQPATPAAFFAWGYGGQFVYDVPGLDLVVVTTTEWRNMDEQAAFDTAVRILGVIVTQILPAAEAGR
jgi:CubicO group peptidase (beta-lactamase class C family)